MKKILFGITSLNLGGAERVLVDLANKLSVKYDVTIFTIYAKGELEKQLCDNVKLKSLYTVSYAELSALQKHFVMPLKVLIQKNSIYKNNVKADYDVEIAFLEGPITRLFSVKNKIVKKIVWIHNDISLVFGKGLKSKLKKKIDENIYTNYDKLIFVSKDNLNKFKKTYPNIKSDKKVIYNYINADEVIKKSKEKQKEKFNVKLTNFVTVTRLVSQKGIDRLIKVHKKLIDNGFIHNFYVIGDGPEIENLKELVKKAEVENTFKLLGKKENPYPYIKNADYFCLFSNFEGYGMVLEEAKILNKKILITDTAAREAVEKYEEAVITENSEKGIYNSIKDAIQNGNKYNEQNSEKMKYNNDEIINEVIKLIEN